ncbi:MAG: SGNH/GDSL hydrolase family protein [Acidimicrobiales bacterium]|nr:SGNH/GDSL hydrolase family protein [Acidimicrobiales bacterium]
MASASSPDPPAANTSPPDDAVDDGRRQVAVAYGWLVVAVLGGGFLVDYWSNRAAIIVAGVALFASLVGIGVAIRKDHENTGADARARRRRIRGLLFGILLALVVVVFVLPKVTGAAPRFAGLSFLAAVTFFVLLSSLINEFRFSPRFSGARGPVIIGIAVGVTVVSLWALAGIRSTVALAGGALAIAIGHIGVVAGSEDWIDRQADQDAGHLRSPRKWIAVLIIPGWFGLGAGLALLLAAGLTWPYALLVVGALGLAVASAASKGDGDLLAILLAVTFIWAGTPTEADPDLPRTTEATYVVLGDSFISGEGAEEFFVGTNVKDSDAADENICRRAPTSWAALLAGSADRPSTVPSSVIFLPCSGAKTRDIHRTDDSQLRQLEQTLAAEPADIQFVLVSIGGNDAGFSILGQTCIGPGNCAEIVESFRDPLAGGVENRLITTYRAIRDAVGDVPIVAVPYPDPINPLGCAGTLLDQAEHRFVSRFVAALNDVVESAAARAGVLYLQPIETALTDTKLRLCDEDTVRDRGINFIEASPMTGSIDVTFNPLNWLNNSIHPNERGHAAMLATAERWFAETQLVNPEPTGEVFVVPPANELVDRATTICPDDSIDCTDREDPLQWQLRQAVLLGRSVWWVIALIAGAAWAASVPIIAAAHARGWTTNGTLRGLRRMLFGS